MGMKYARILHKQLPSQIAKCVIMHEIANKGILVCKDYAKQKQPVAVKKGAAK